MLRSVDSRYQYTSPVFRATNRLRHCTYIRSHLLLLKVMGNSEITHLLNTVFKYKLAEKKQGFEFCKGI
jgi:hypothetical protein